MDIYDKRAVSAVWQRVRQGRTNDELEQRLSEAIGFERGTAHAYLAMARCSGNALFQQLAAQERHHAKKLSTLYYLLFECPPYEDASCPAKIGSFRDAVRMAYQGEKMAIERYERMANDFHEHKELFSSLAEEEKRHAYQMHRIAQRLLKYR